jgi:hypothetical protein
MHLCFFIIADFFPLFYFLFLLLLLMMPQSTSSPLGCFAPSARAPFSAPLRLWPPHFVPLGEADAVRREGVDLMRKLFKILNNI